MDMDADTPVTVTVDMVRAEAGHQPRELNHIVLQHICNMHEDPRGHPKKDKIRLTTGTMLLKKFVKGKTRCTTLMAFQKLHGHG